MRTNKTLASRAQVDLIPMIDVVFQLILFFLVSTTFAVMPAISLKLPDSTTSSGAEVRGITITVTADSSIFCNDKAVTISELDSMLSITEISEEERLTYPVRFEADELVTNGTIVKIFDVLRKNGFSNVNLMTSDVH